eukprot:TRINITY_DN7065_c0_g1_i1.p1 TRINITY_DN7065_c0_g1~~TRINITY_DN7065_c0_g1_i1.p1  ORF type:complete len:258 (-),score=84.74 TRINITY_DN7065_c0_g1_i1:1135-1908(-)
MNNIKDSGDPYFSLLNLKEIQPESSSISPAKKISELKNKAAKLTQELKEAVEEKEAMGKSLRHSREINKALIGMLYENGVIREGKSIFSLFRDASLKPQLQDSYVEELREVYMAIKLEEVKKKPTFNATEQLQSIKIPGKSNLVTALDVKSKNFKKLERWETLNQAMIKLSKCKTHDDIIINVPSALEGILEFDKMSIIPLSSKFTLNESSKLAENGLLSLKEFCLDKWIRVICSTQHPCSKLQFTSIAQLIAGRKK